MAEKHIAIRTCIATGEKHPKSEMIRLVKEDDGSVAIDLKGKLKGRGANLSMDIAAFELAIKKKAINRALKLEKALTEEQINKLREEFLKAIEHKKFRKGNKPVTIEISKEEFEKIAG
ncbi:MAG TPA: YlxR family protein [Candidatus Dojkabacteria bacterium]|nr:YlxR family protein [Candidatus Dojkabacteria bacterium]